MKKIKTRSIVDGDASGEIMYTSQPIAFLQGVDPEGGFVSDRKHELHGRRFAGKILVFPNAVGSSVGAYVIYRLRMNGNAPKAMVNKRADIITASGCAISGIPLYEVSEDEYSSLNSGRVSLDKKRSHFIVES